MKVHYTILLIFLAFQTISGQSSLPNTSYDIKTDIFYHSDTMSDDYAKSRCVLDIYLST